MKHELLTNMLYTTDYHHDMGVSSDASGLLIMGLLAAAMWVYYNWGK